MALSATAAILAGALTGCLPSSSAAARSPLGTPASAPVGTGGFSLLATHHDGSAVTFDPCQAVYVVIRPDHEPPGGRALLLSVLGELSAATGLEFRDDGATTEGPEESRASRQPGRYGDRWAPVLITWSSPAETTILTDDVLGRAGPDIAGSGDQTRFVSGSAVFNAPLISAQLSSGEEDKARAVLLHELGHLVGLGHVDDPFQVMYDTNSYPLARYRDGDLRGLHELGTGPCF